MKDGQIILPEKRMGPVANPDPENGYLSYNHYYGFAIWHKFKGQIIFNVEFIDVRG